MVMLFTSLSKHMDKKQFCSIVLMRYDSSDKENKSDNCGDCKIQMMETRMRQIKIHIERIWVVMNHSSAYVIIQVFLHVLIHGKQSANNQRVSYQWQESVKDVECLRNTNF